MANKSPRLTLTPRERVFCRLVGNGLTHSEAYRRAYFSKASPQCIAEMACKVAARPRCVEEIARLGQRAELKTLLTLNDRLAILADIAQTRGKSPGHLAAKTRAVDVYSKISGDQAPMRIENTGKDGGPIAVSATVALNVTRVPVRERIRLLKEAREREKSADAAANPGK